MKILYSIQATGNGHIARAIELMPYLQQYGEVDVFLSGSNSNLQFNLPVKYRSRGVSLFYGSRGRLDYKKIYKEFSFLRMWKEAKALPVEEYDIVLNDFESITSLACKIKGVPSVNFGHQASFHSKNTPLSAKRDLLGETILRNYATATAYVGLHFERYDDFIFNPVIKQDILDATPLDCGHITVYLSHYADEVVAAQLKKVTGVKFEVFSKKATAVTVDGNITFIPVSNKAFNESMIHCHGMITGAGFETPAEVLYMGKKLLCIPIKGQYEQLCNAAALAKFNVPVIDRIDESFNAEVESWLSGPSPKKLTLTHSTYDVVQHAITVARQLNAGKSRKKLENMESYA